MPQGRQENQFAKEEEIYERYSAMLYGFIRKATPVQEQVDDIFVESFKIYFQQGQPLENKDHPFFNLIRIAIRLYAEKNHVQDKGRLAGEFNGEIISLIQ